MKSGRVPIDGGWLAFHRTGDDGLPPVVLLPGLTDNGLCWRRTALALANDHDVVMLDARGHGDSSRCVPGHAFEPGRDLAQALAGLAVERPALVGHSVGGRAAADFAADHPDRVSRLILEDPAFTPSPVDPERRRARFRDHVLSFQGLTPAQIIARGREASPGWSPDDLPDWADAKLQTDPEALPLPARPWEDAVAALRVPTWILHGEADRGSLMTAEILAEIRRLSPGIRTRQIPGAGHNTRRENFPVFLDALRAALR